ncbi:LytR/AlgR family response regulator transcription factor [Defluviitalea phaphyphila]|uniref:LytR/AlgR family response regulator transcription factor n=1 Tax=Defluviitalea phaphyphila TaxID=1473580 RepID=UPI000730AD9E|nr:LytTR family transcriptional regulator DNA-binding domain-containing protein [Defluviitalea phaphyphila]
MIQVILVDDERPALEELEYMLEKYENIEVVGTYTDPLIALKEIKRKKPQVVFLDISMPEIDGFSLAKEIIKLNFKVNIVFVTAFDEYAISAFEINAVDYILKPLCEERLDSTINRIRDNIKQDAIKINSIQEVVRQLKKPLIRIPVWKKDRIILLDPKEILYCTVEGGETYVVTEKEKYFISDTLSHLEEELEGFFRCHRSFLINTEYIDEIIPWFNNTYAVKMKNRDEEIPVSRRHSKVLKEMFHIK